MALRASAAENDPVFAELCTVRSRLFFGPEMSAEDFFDAFLTAPFLAVVFRCAALLAVFFLAVIGHLFARSSR
jgi:hypothetical protein